MVKRAERARKVMREIFSRRRRRRSRKHLELIDRKHRLIMDWSAKAGCTVVVKMFFRHMGLLEEALRYDSWVHEYRHRVFSPRNRVTDADLRNPDYFKFKVVRNPFTRAVSSYVQAMRFGPETATMARVLGAADTDLSFNEFLRYLAHIDLETCNHHHRLQRKPYERQGASPFDLIVRIEALRDGVRRLNEVGGFRFSVEGLGSSHHVAKSPGRENVADKPWSHLRDAIPDYRWFYNRETVQRVATLYGGDLEAYGYEFDLA